MNQLLATLKGRSSEIVKILSSKDEIIPLPNFEKTVVYQSSYKLEEDEWFKLTSFKELNYMNQIIHKPFNTTNYNQITKDLYLKIKYFCSKQGNCYLFQKMQPTQILSKRWFSISDEPILETKQSILILSNTPDAIYDSNNDILYFKEIARIKAVFSGIEELYREATDDEVESFLKQKFLQLVDSFNGQMVKTANRKRIAMVMSELEKLTETKKQQLLKYTREYCKNVKYKNSAFIIGNEEDLKNVLYGVLERYYTTPISGEKRLANSVLILNK